ncbi:MAG: hypothetical protein AAF591_20755 [Verrucomicrobiota bacterium]
MNLFLIDAIGPFFRDDDRYKINWSKIPFDQLKLDGPDREPYFARIREDFDTFCRRVAEIGYNAVSLDDLAHLADHEWIEPEIRERIAILREEFTKLFAIAQSHGLDVYLTTDIVSYTPALKKRLGSDPDKTNGLIRVLIDDFLRDFPQVAGLILRIGETDGLDVEGDFKSELHLKTPAKVNRFLHELLPVFEKHDRKLIFRTWTVGAYPVGDLMWHRRTFARALKDIDSPAIIVSMKYGESDFFRYLPLNANFFRTELPTIVELQTRREYEGCGEYPSFVGWDYERYARDLKEAPNLVGISVWCQTGGWHPFRRLAYIGDGSPWTEINTFVTLKIFRDDAPVEDALRACLPDAGQSHLLEFFRLSDEVIKELLYIEEFAQQKLFFRRVRIPTLLGVYWNNIFVNHSLRKLMRHFVSDPEACIRAGRSALTKIKEMKVLAAEADLPVDDIAYMEQTFEILALAREYFFLPYDESVAKRLKKAKKRYKKAYPKRLRPRYSIRLDFEPFHVRRRFLNWSLAVALRRRRGYRAIDSIFTIHFLSFVYRAVRTTRPKWIPKFARKSAMGIDTVFR